MTSQTFRSKLELVLQVSPLKLEAHYIQALSTIGWSVGTTAVWQVKRVRSFSSFHYNNIANFGVKTAWGASLFPCQLVITRTRDNGAPGKLSRGMHPSYRFCGKKVHGEWQGTSISPPGNMRKTSFKHDSTPSSPRTFTYNGRHLSETCERFQLKSHEDGKRE